MQLYKNIKLVVLSTILSTVFLFSFLFVPIVSAQYGRDAYGSCAYGQPCPTDEPGTNGVQPPVDPSPVNPTDPSSPSTPQSPSTTTNPGGPTSGQSIAPYEKIVLSRRAGWVEKLSPTQQKIIPLIFWILLLILAIILLIQSIFDRLRARQLEVIVHTLNTLIEDKKNFVRLVMHHINTPLATIKSAAELLNSVKDKEHSAIILLRPATLELNAIADEIGTNDSNEKTSSELLRTTPEITLKNMLSRWYFIVPVAIAIVLGIGSSWIIVASGVDYSSGYWLFNVSFSIMSIVILFNSLRLWRIGRDRNFHLTKIETIMNQLNDERQKTITVLATKLQSTIYDLTKAKNAIKDQKYAQFIQNSIDELQQLANKVSSTSRPLTKAGLMDVDKIISSAIKRHKQLADSKHITINRTSAKNEVPLNTDEVYFITDSLLDNAIKYNHENGSISIKATQANKKLEIDITDTGEGLSNDAKQQLFEPFSKTEGVITYDESGMGLSLYASKILANRLGGSVRLSSKPGHGTTARLELPIPN